MNSKQKFEEQVEEEKENRHINLIAQNGNDGLIYYNEHYQKKEINGLDVIDLVKYWNLNFNEGNILKYLLRDKEDRVKDLTKIVDYTKREIEFLNNK